MKKSNECHETVRKAEVLQYFDMEELVFLCNAVTCHLPIIYAIFVANKLRNCRHDRVRIHQAKGNRGNQ
jgi:hypothetical protein